MARLFPAFAVLLLLLGSAPAPAAEPAGDPGPAGPFEPRRVRPDPMPENPSFPVNHKPPQWERWHNPSGLMRFSLRGYLGVASFLDSVIGTDANPYPLTLGSVVGTTTLFLGVELGFRPLKFLEVSASYARFSFRSDRGSPGSTLVQGSDYILAFQDYRVSHMALCVRLCYPIDLFSMAREDGLFADDLFAWEKVTDIEGLVPFLKVGAGASLLGDLSAQRRTDLGGGDWSDTPVKYLEGGTNFLGLLGAGFEFKFSFLSILLAFEVHWNGVPRSAYPPWSDPETLFTWSLAAGVGFHL